jgi:hypothetical protein
LKSRYPAADRVLNLLLHSAAFAAMNRVAQLQDKLKKLIYNDKLYVLAACSLLLPFRQSCVAGSVLAE